VQKYDNIQKKSKVHYNSLKKRIRI